MDMHKRSKLLEVEFYDRSMYSPESKPKSAPLSRLSLMWLRAACVIVAVLISLLAFSCKRETGGPVMKDESAIISKKINVEQVASDIADGVIQRIKDTPNRHMLIARFSDGSAITTQLAPYAEMLKKSGSEEELKETIQSVIAIGINAGVVEYGLMVVKPDPFKQAAN